MDKQVSLENRGCNGRRLHDTRGDNLVLGHDDVQVKVLCEGTLNFVLQGLAKRPHGKSALIGRDRVDRLTPELGKQRPVRLVDLESGHRSLLDALDLLNLGPHALVGSSEALGRESLLQRKEGELVKSRHVRECIQSGKDQISLLVCEHRIGSVDIDGCDYVLVALGIRHEIKHALDLIPRLDCVV